MTFAAVDGLAFAAARRRLPNELPPHIARDLGPIVELFQLARVGGLPSPLTASWLHSGSIGELFVAVANGVDRCTTGRGGRVGVFHCSSNGNDSSRWKAFKIEAHKSALAAGFSTQVVGRLIGAMGEIQDNVNEHSQATATGLVFFNSLLGVFEFAVADAGIGALASLQTNSEYAHLRDEGEALECALSDGQSRFGISAGRGTGFSQLFKSLASLNASLRFRSGDHAISIDGKSPTLVGAQVAKKPHITGFLACVRCRLH